MAKPLRVGVAGLGIVGGGAWRACCSGVRADLAARTGRDISIVAVSARSTGAIAASVWAKPPSSPIRATSRRTAKSTCSSKLIGGADGVAYEAVAAALARGLPV